MENNNSSPDTGKIKAVILIGGPEKGTRFRPLSFDCPKPLFPVAGEPMLSHLIEACCRLRNLIEICIIGWYQAAGNDALTKFINETQRRFDVPIRYLQEFTPLGTAGSVYHFRDHILVGPEVSHILLLNGDVCGDFPLAGLLDLQKNRKDAAITMLATEATRSQSMQFGCVVEDPKTQKVLHYINKPQSYVSSLVSCGVYLMRPSCFTIMAQILAQRKTVAFKLENSPPSKQATNNLLTLSFEDEVLPRAAETGQLYVHRTSQWWSQVKTAASTIYANRHYLQLYRENNSSVLASRENCSAIIKGDVFIHPTATIHPTAEIGPNVSIGAGVKIGAGTRIRESIILGDAVIGEHCCILFSIVGWGCQTGDWVRVEGFPNDPDPNKPFAKLEHMPMFTPEGKLNPSITILGGHVEIPSEVIVLNSIVLPNKCLDAGVCKNQIMF